MYLSELFETKKAVYSFEIFPPKKTSSVDTIYNTLDEMAELRPDFISVTYGAGGSSTQNLTCEIATNIKNKYNIEPLAHLTCINSHKEDIEFILEELKQNNIKNILALRGDKIDNAKPVNDFSYASDLIGFIKDNYNFNIVGACYPEGHPQSTNIDLDVQFLKDKVNKGANHLISQLFFDNNDFYNFMYQVRNEGINVPIQAGIMPVVNKKNIQRLVTLCGASFPKKFVKMLSRYENNEEALFDAGIAYATEQIIDLLSNSVSGIHLYTMNNAKIARRITDNIKNILNHINSGA